MSKRELRIVLAAKEIMGGPILLPKEFRTYWDERGSLSKLCGPCRNRRHLCCDGGKCQCDCSLELDMPRN